MTVYAINVPDHVGTREGAAALASRIVAYWHERGARTVQAWAQHDVGADKTTQQALFVVRSNLVAGLPPGRSA